MTRQGGWHRPVLALLVALVLPWLVGAAGPAPDPDRAAETHSVAHVDQSRMGSAPGGHRITAAALPNIPYATVSLDAVCPAGPASPVPSRFWHGYVAAALSSDALATAASRGRAPPAS